MAVSTIDGTLEEVELRRKALKVRIFNKLVFRLADGGTKTIKGAHVHIDVAPYLTAGTSGRFYIFNSIDHRGLQGVRTSDGRAVFAYPRNNEIVGLWLTVIGVLWVGLVLLATGGIPILGGIVLALAIVVLVVNGNLRREAQRLYDADSGYAPAAQPIAAAPEPAAGA